MLVYVQDSLLETARYSLLDSKTVWGPAHQLEPRGPQTDYEPLRPTSSLSARLGPRNRTGIPQTYWDPLNQLGTARPTGSCTDRLGSSQTDRGPVDVLGAAQTDWVPLRSIGAPQMYWKPLRLLGELLPIGDPQTDWGPVDRLGAAKLTGAYHKHHTDWSPVEVGIGGHSDRLGSCTPTGAPQTYLELLIPTGVQQTPDWLGDAKTGWSPSHRLGLRRLTGSRSDRQVISQPDCGPAARLRPRRTNERR